MKPISPFIDSVLRPTFSHLIFMALSDAVCKALAVIAKRIVCARNKTLQRCFARIATLSQEPIIKSIFACRTGDLNIGFLELSYPIPKETFVIYWTAVLVEYMFVIQPFI